MDDRQAFRQVSHEFPRSTVQHAVRVSFGHTAALLLDEVRKAAAIAYPKARGIEKKYYQGFFDLTFHDATDAEEAASIPLMVQGKRIPTSRCRWNQDKTMYITLTKIPTTLTREDTIQQLTKSLETYGEVINFEMESDDILTHLTMPRAIAIIKPNEDVLADLTLIPRAAYLYDKQCEKVTEGFRISPETAPPICSSCNCIGHRANSCPKTVEGIQYLMDTQDEEMEDDPRMYTNEHEYPWGETANYKVVEPVTPHARRAAKKAIARQRREEREAVVAEAHQSLAPMGATPIIHESPIHGERPLPHQYHQLPPSPTTPQSSMDTIDDNVRPKTQLQLNTKMDAKTTAQHNLEGLSDSTNPGSRSIPTTKQLSGPTTRSATALKKGVQQA